MTVLRECFVLPGIFLTVALLGGFRAAERIRLVPPPLISLVLGLLLVGCLVRAAVLVPDRFMNSGRSAAANLSGLAVLLSLFAACAQVFNLVTPETGLLHALFSVFFLVQLLTTLAAARDRVPLLRGLTVLLGSAFLIRFVVLDSLYSPERGLVKRIVTAMMEGVTLGAVDYQANAAATGYVAFFTLTIFMIGLVLLGHDTLVSGTDLERWAGDKLVQSSLLVLALAPSIGCGDAASLDARTDSPGRSVELREAALASARVWEPPQLPIGQVNLGENPPGGWSATDDVACRFVVTAATGTTPKFNCELPSGETVKVKYGRRNPELYVEVAATRLLSTLGFGADRMFVVRSVRCEGCPPFPFAAMRCYARTGLRSCFAAGLDSDVVEFRHAVIERRLEGRLIEASPDQGWAWYELGRIDPARGGSPRAEVDALRLMAVFLAHWDNKAPNQRLICPRPHDRPEGSCGRPLAIMQDLGATFGPTKLDLHNWQRTGIWADPRECRVSMKDLPWDGATFPDATISDEGRRHLLGLLEQLTRQQLVTLFDAAGMTAFDSLNADARRAVVWARAFEEKVRQIRDAGPCPPGKAISRTAAQ